MRIRKRFSYSRAGATYCGLTVGRRGMAKLQSLLDAIGQNGKALDVYINAYPLVLSPPSGSLRVVFHVSQNPLLFHPLAAYILQAGRRV